MNVREKLVELANDVLRYLPWGEIQKDTAERIAERMIDHGVTVQEWISVKDQEEPTKNGTYLCHGYWFGSRREQTETAEFFGEWNIANNFILTHWMPLPQPPKGE
jgi:hypothetical protein